MIQISKELLTSVFEKPVTLSRIEDGDYYASVLHTEHRTITIFEFSYMCKAWALKNGFSLLSGFDKETKLQTCFINLGHGLTECSIDVWCEDFTAPTEEETIFLACEHILKKLI